MKKLKYIAIALMIGSVGFAFNYNSESTTANMELIPKRKKKRVGTNVGDMAPDLNFQSPDGRNMKLSSLRGKYVLVDFWASWCGPCRRENPHVVSAYRKYNAAKFKDGKGFEVFSVSLDKNKDAWKNAIKQDGLFWRYHVSDLGGWQSKAAQLYSVRSIPASFLVDPKGKIVAKDLRGQQIHLALDKYLEKL